MIPGERTANASLIPADPTVQHLKDSREDLHERVSSEEAKRRLPDLRTPGEKDYDRIMYSHSFLRLGGVTQILPPNASLPRVHNRLTHSLKVAQVAKSIAQNIISQANVNGKQDYIRSLGGLDADVAAAAGLAHDIGHPPFGHAGEHQLDRMSYGGNRIVDTRSGFEGNAQTFRIVVKLEQSHTVRAGLRLTAGTRAAILKYPWPREQDGFRSRKFGFYAEDAEEFDKARAWLGASGISTAQGARTLIGDGQQTLEATIMDLADDISYAIHDLEDFLSLGVIRSSTILFHCGNFVDKKADRYNPIRDLVEQLSRDYGEDFSEDSLRAACESVLEQYLPHNESDPSHMREWRNSQLVYLLDEIELLDEPKGDKGARVAFTNDAWHRVELFKFFAKKYVIQRKNTALLQRSGNAVLRNTLNALRQWDRDGYEAWEAPIRLRMAQEWMRELSGQYGRHYLDFICMLSDAELVELSGALTGNGLPKAL